MKTDRPASIVSDASADVMTLEALAHRWHVSPRTVDRMLKKGEFAHFRIGRQKRILVCDVLAYEKKMMR